MRRGLQGAQPPRALASYAEDTEYSDIGPGVVEAVAQLTPVSFWCQKCHSQISATG